MFVLFPILSLPKPEYCTPLLLALRSLCICCCNELNPSSSSSPNPRPEASTFKLVATSFVAELMLLQSPIPIELTSFTTFLVLWELTVSLANEKADENPDAAVPNPLESVP